jgi:CheY-like chemotaxis protein
VPRVLVLEDDEVVRSIIRRMLLRGGYEIIEADTTRSGLEKTWSLEADVVLGDMCLGRRDGISVMAAIRHARPGMPLVAVSGRSEDEIWARFSAEGLRESVWCLPKPFTQDDLLGTLERALTPPT